MQLSRALRGGLQLCSLLCIATVSALSHGSDFENTAIVRSVDLGGATTQVTTTYQVRSLRDGSRQYDFTIPAEDASRTSWIEVKIKGSSTPLILKNTHADDVSVYSALLPKPLDVNETATLVFTILQSHASVPVPASIRQTEPLYLKYDSSLYVLSGYATVIQRLKIRTPTQHVKDFTNLKSSKFSDKDGTAVTRSGSTITYGPFRNVPAWSDPTFREDTTQTVSVHYELDSPVTVVKSLKRTAEISHWGSNLNIQDNVWLQNEGAELKGHFSRLEHIRQRVLVEASQPHILRNLVLHLPSGIRDPYIYDVIGNVSTTRFRPAPPRRQAALSTTRVSPLERQSVLELTPRYPLLGGWNYTFTMGYDMPLQDWVGYDKAKDAYVVAIPFLTQFPGAAFDDAEAKIILPEAAKLLEYHLPFPVDSIQEETHLTYLDSVGRPSIVFRKSNVTNEHAQLVYVTYSVDSKAHFQKPLTVATVLFGVFVMGMTLRRVDFSIRSKKRA